MKYLISDKGISVQLLIWRLQGIQVSRVVFCLMSGDHNLCSVGQVVVWKDTVEI